MNSCRRSQYYSKSLLGFLTDSLAYAYWFCNTRELEVYGRSQHLDISSEAFFFFYWISFWVSLGPPHIGMIFSLEIKKLEKEKKKLEHQSFMFSSWLEHSLMLFTNCSWRCQILTHSSLDCAWRTAWLRTHKSQKNLMQTCECVIRSLIEEKHFVDIAAFHFLSVVSFGCWGRVVSISTTCSIQFLLMICDLECSKRVLTAYHFLLDWV